MINWTEEDVQFVFDNMVMPAMEQVVQLIESSNDSNDRIFESLTKSLDKVNYQQTREISLLKTSS